LRGEGARRHAHTSKNQAVAWDIFRFAATTIAALGHCRRRGLLAPHRRIRWCARRVYGAGCKLGPLAGVPFAAKNLFDIAGLLTRVGSKISREHPPAKAPTRA